MKQTINFSQFTDEFDDMGRSDNFSYQGLEALYNHLLDYEEETGFDIELDVIALCCEFSEYESLHDALMQYESEEFYDEDEETGKDEERRETIARQYLQDRTTLIEFDSGVIIADF